MPFTGPEFLRTWFNEVWNKGRAEAIDEFASADWIGHGLTDHLPGRSDLSHLDRFKALYRDYRRAFPDITITAGRTVSEGHLVAAHCELKGTHTGDGLSVCATGRLVHITGTVIARIENEKIVESWDSWACTSNSAST